MKSFYVLYAILQVSFQTNYGYTTVKISHASHVHGSGDFKAVTTTHDKVTVRNTTRTRTMKPFKHVNLTKLEIKTKSKFNNSKSQQYFGNSSENQFHSTTNLLETHIHNINVRNMTNNRPKSHGKVKTTLYQTIKDKIATRNTNLKGTLKSLATLKTTPSSLKVTRETEVAKEIKSSHDERDSLEPTESNFLFTPSNTESQSEYIRRQMWSARNAMLSQSYTNVQRSRPQQHSGVYQKNPKTEELLSKYRNIVNKFGPNFQQNQASLYTGSSNRQINFNGHNFKPPNQNRLFHGFHRNISVPFRQARVIQGNIKPALRDDGAKENEPKNNEETTVTDIRDHPDYPGNPDQPYDPNQSETTSGHTNKTKFPTPTRRRRRTTPYRVSLEEDCDYLAYYCLKAFDTGQICGRTLFFAHMTFQNYCMLDYVNCMERYDLWQIAHMGECIEIKILTEYKFYPYNDDYFLDQYYVAEDML